VEWSCEGQNQTKTLTVDSEFVVVSDAVVGKAVVVEDELAGSVVVSPSSYWIRMSSQQHSVVLHIHFGVAYYWAGWKWSSNIRG